jgi:hypothetical protein
LDAHEENSNSSSSSLSHKRSESVSFRLNEDIAAELRRYAEQKRISVNTLANQIFDYYFKFANSASNEMMPISKAMMVELVEGYSEDELKSIIERVCRKAATEVALQLRGSYDFQASIDILGYYLESSGFPYKHTIDEQNKKRHTFIIQYGMGRRWSLFAAEAWSIAFQPVLAREAEYAITDNMLAITFEEKNRSDNPLG